MYCYLLCCKALVILHISLEKGRYLQGSRIPNTNFWLKYNFLLKYCQIIPFSSINLTSFEIKCSNFHSKKSKN